MLFLCYRVNFNKKRGIRMAEFKRNRYATFKLSYHLILVTKNRKKNMTEAVLKRLKEITKELFNDWGCEVVKFVGEEDNLQIVFNAPPQFQLSKAINDFQTTSSRSIQKEFDGYLNYHVKGSYFWSRNYMVITTGLVDDELIRKHIEAQGDTNIKTSIQSLV